jgi:hypothetical protein
LGSEKKKEGRKEEWTIEGKGKKEKGRRKPIYQEGTQQGRCYRGLKIWNPVPPNSYVETLTHKVKVLGGGFFRR